MRKNGLTETHKTVTEARCNRQAENPAWKALRPVIVILGIISLSLGFIGLFVPLLPTTPFLLLASFCFMRSSKRLHRWLMNHRIFGEYIYFYTKHKAIRRRTKVVAIATLWIALGFSIFLVDMIHARIALIAIGAAVSIHILLLRTVEKVPELTNAEIRRICEE